MSGDPVCCFCCGRDTWSRSGICNRCHRNVGTMPSEQYGRKARYSKEVDDDQPDEETSATRYHGDNWQDD